MEEQTYSRDYKKINETTIAKTQNSTKNVQRERRESITTIKTLLSKTILNLDGLNSPPQKTNVS